LDLLFTDKSRTGGQVAQVVDEFARFIDKSDGAGNYLNGWAELDQYMWNYNPRTTSDHKGTFYKTPMNDTRFGGTWTRTLATADFEGMVNYLINFMTDTDPNSWAIGDGDQRGYGFNYLESEAADAAIPFTPTVAYSGTSGFPSDKLKFTASAYSDPNGSPFASMEWRIGEISSPGTPGFNAAAPWKYEINSVWESGELAAFNAQVSIPAGILQTGHTYRLRVRYKDDTGRWSHWSDVSTGTTQFLATAPVGIIQTSLRITELNYNPAANGGSLPGNAADINDYEFIELKNFGSQSINLQNVQFSTGVTLTFGDVSLNPGESGVVVRNLANFQARYGTSIKVLGVYAGSLDNGGERIVLLNSDGSTLKDFTYDDTGTGWYPTTDGGGPTLVVRNPASNPDLSAAANWRASFQVGGTPGSDETTPRVMGVTLLGSSWQTAGYAIPTGAAQSAILPWSGIDAIKITFDQNVTVQQANLIVQSSVLLTPTLAISGFSYDAATFTALWSLASAVGADRIRLNLADTVHGIDNFNLDGDWNSKLNFPSGDGISGGAFVFDLNVLPGDVDRNGVVQAADGLAVRILLGAAAGDGSYSAFADTNHNGVIQASDGLLVRGQLGSSLPDASFAAVSFAATPAAALVAIPTGLVASPLGRIGLLNSLPTIVSTSGVPKTTATIVALKIPIPTARPNVGKIAPRGGELPRISNPWVHLQTVPPQSFMALQPDFHFVVDISTHPALITKES
ncbi:MAG TPA: lamin tail domain-containing protein, partial [Phycisphaerae bacterium]|nr:lamin tail domain-containing protein [Phycisphaerae bacterium]